MLSLGYATIILLLVIIGVVGMVAGYMVANSRQRRAAGGKSVDELKTELDEYKSNVTEHFQTTAGLLQNMTEQYRSVYEHMAAGAEQLCDTANTTAQIESLRTGLLPTPDAPTATTEDEHPADVDTSVADRIVSAEPSEQVPSSADDAERLEPAEETISEASGVLAAINQQAEGPMELPTSETTIEVAQTSADGDENKLG